MRFCGFLSWAAQDSGVQAAWYIYSGMFDLPLLLAWSGSDPAAGCANHSCQSTAEGCADPHRVCLERGPSVAPQQKRCASEGPLRVARPADRLIERVRFTADSPLEMSQRRSARMARSCSPPS